MNVLTSAANNIASCMYIFINFSNLSTTMHNIATKLAVLMPPTTNSGETGYLLHITAYGTVLSFVKTTSDIAKPRIMNFSEGYFDPLLVGIWHPKN